MKISCVWEHNGDDTLLHAIGFPGAFSRGENLQSAMEKMICEIQSYFAWLKLDIPENFELEIVQNQPCDLQVCDADSDVLFVAERQPLSREEYQVLKELALKSAENFQLLYDSVPYPDVPLVSERRTFYGKVPSTAREMYVHTKNVNAYYFAEIDVETDNEGSILDCRRRGFEQLEKTAGFLENPMIEGSYGEFWTLRKVIRRFLWHDRIHARAMYRHCIDKFGVDQILNVFCFNFQGNT